MEEKQYYVAECTSDMGLLHLYGPGNWEDCIVLMQKLAKENSVSDECIDTNTGEAGQDGYEVSVCYAEPIVS